MQVDPTVSFADVGGLGHYVQSLKEMVFLPLVYPEVFAQFKVTPPRGVLLYGPPGTGKTLIARALAASAARSGTKVSEGGGGRVAVRLDVKVGVGTRAFACPHARLRACASLCVRMRAGVRVRARACVRPCV